MPQLYYLPGSAALAPHLVLEEAGVPVELVRVTRENGIVVDPPDYTRISPFGRVPAFVDGDLVMTEAAAIVMHLCDVHGLAPEPGSADRARWYRWLVYLTNTVQPALIGVFYPGRTAAGPDGEAAILAGAIRQLDEHRAYVSDALGDGPWLLGERFSTADYYLAMLTRWTRRLERKWWGDPRIGAHYRRTIERPAAQRVWALQGLDDTQ